MTITTKLRLSSIVAVGMVLIFIGTSLVLVTELRHAYQKQQIVEQITEKSFQLALLRSEYVLHPSERPKTQWINMYESQAIAIDQATNLFTTIEEKELLNDARTVSQDNRILFGELIKNIEQGGNATVIEELTNQMSIKSQERVSDVLRLADISRANVVDVEKVFTVVMAIFGLLIILTLLWLQKKATARTQDLERANERLRQLDRAKTDFISITSHQLRTPLTALLWLSEEPYPPLDEIKISVRRLATLVEDLLNVSKIQLGKFKDGAQMISLEKIIHETINDVQHYATLKEHAIDFVKKSEQQNIIISINPNALTIIMHNLLTNAIDYGEQKTPITVEFKSTL